jgi:hypothetical protein
MCWKYEDWEVLGELEADAREVTDALLLFVELPKGDPESTTERVVMKEEEGQLDEE